MGFSFAVWNVEKFTFTPQRVVKVAELIAGHDPDVIGILEFRAKQAARRLVRNPIFEKYDFAFTDSDRGLEILVGWKRTKFAQVLFTQRLDLQVGNRNLRPGGLISVLPKDATRFTNLLFLHTDSGTDETAFKNRQAMFSKVWKMNQALAGLPEQSGKSSFVVLGDLNTMGQKGKLDGAEEIKRLAAKAQSEGMRMLTKSHPETWNNGSMKSNLDHVIASDDLAFKSFGAAAAQHEVRVDGWVNLSGTARKSFIETISDHCLLYAEVA